jgi:hypothetical protein
MEEEEEYNSTIIPDIESVLNFTQAISQHKEMINLLSENLKNGLFKNENLSNFIDREGKFFDSFNCSFLKSDLSMIYNALYDLSVESRILCALSCCIGFFGAIAVYFYLLVMYHYNNTDFQEGMKTVDITRPRRRKYDFDRSSRNQFSDTSKSFSMKKFNKLDNLNSNF